MAAHNELGQWGENLATEYLRSKGYVIIDRDWRSGHRDLDIIAEDDDVVVFVEVKTRRNNFFGEPEEAIDFRKQRSLQQTINHYVKAWSGVFLIIETYLAVKMFYQSRHCIIPKYSLIHPDIV